MNLLKELFDHETKELKKFEKIADKVVALDEEMQALNDYELKAKTDEFKERLEKGETLEDILVEAFAVVREAAYRVIGEKPFKVQIIGGLAIHYGNISEMKTGEGKTLTSTMPAYLNALDGKGVHIVTVNEYLAGRDADWMGKIHEFLGLKVGVNYRELTPSEKREAYECDITYSTNSEIGFDYLRDNMVIKKEDRVQRKLNFCIIDEVDSVLIDEARTPLIISGGELKSNTLYIDADTCVKPLKEDEDYVFDIKTKAVTLTDKGTEICEKFFKLDNLYDLKNSAIVHHINQALRANYAMTKDVDYVVKDDKIVIVDQFTGRLMEGRAFSEGLHQAIEAKEGVTIQKETKTLATITYQNLFRMYAKIAGMTGTAKTEEEEFRNIYNMYVITIPTNKPIVREDYADIIFATEKGKFKAIVDEIKERHEIGQPVLVGTIAIETSELLSSMLKKEKIPHQVLNAKNHGKEAEIIKNAGEKGSVTIATNMAGRGTDIKLGEGVVDLGGLCVLGTERHESRRIDNQLRGRAGRQGDPGFSQFCVSLEDELMRRFGSDKLQGMLGTVGFDGDSAIRSKMFTKSVESAQRRVEGNNYDIRKQLLEYDNVITDQREIIYEKRNEILDEESIHDMIIECFKRTGQDLVRSHIEPEGYLTDHDLSEIVEFVNTALEGKDTLGVKAIKEKSTEEVIDLVTEKLLDNYDKKVQEVNAIPEDAININDFEKAISLKIIDTYWMEHINTMDHLREGIGLRGYAQENPLRAYTLEGYELFDNLLASIDKDIVLYLLRAEIRYNLKRTQVMKGQAVTDSTKENKKKQPKRVKKVGRNEPCPCNSGKKYKNCCGK